MSVVVVRRRETSVCMLSGCKEQKRMCSFVAVHASILSCEDSLVTLRIYKKLWGSKLAQKVDRGTQGSAFLMRIDQAGHSKVCSTLSRRLRTY